MAETLKVEVPISTEEALATVTVSANSLYLFAQKGTGDSGNYALKAKAADGKFITLASRDYLTNNFYTKTDLDSKLLKKVDLLTYTKDINLKANIADVYSKTEANIRFGSGCIVIVANLRERDTQDHNKLVYVKDATGDPSIKAGGAVYIFDNTSTTWVKICESESMDLEAWLEAHTHTHPNLMLLNSYTQTEEDLAEAVRLKHNHENKAVIDEFGENADGRPTYKGQDITAVIDTSTLFEPVTFPFTYVAEEQSEVRFDLVALQLDPLMHVSVWSRQVDDSGNFTGTEELINPSMWYTSSANASRQLVIDFNDEIHGITFPTGEYNIRFIRIKKNENATINHIVKEFTKIEGDRFVRFSMEELGITERVDADIYQLTLEGNHDLTNMDIVWSATNEMVIDTEGFPVGTYELSFMAINIITSNQGETTT